MGSTARAALVGLAVAVGMIVAGWVAVVPPPAAAHAVVVSSTPNADDVVQAAPASVSIMFNEPVEATADSVDVISPSGRHVVIAEQAARSAVTLNTRIEADDPGTYTVVYRVVSADGHAVVGSFVFHVGFRSGAGVGASEVAKAENTGGVPGVIGFVARSMHYIGMLGFVGMVVGVALLRPDVEGDGERGGARVSERLLGRRGVARWYAIAGLVGALLILLVRAGSVSGLGFDRVVAELPTLIGGSRVLRFDLDRVILTALALGATLVAARCSGRSPARGARIARALAATAGAAALAVSSVAGHAGTTSPRALGVGIDLVHLAGVSVWLGGLLVVIAALRDQAVAPTDGAALADDVEFAGRAAVGRFSRIAVGVFPVVVLTGVGSSLFHVDSLELLASTTYGRLLLAKAVGVAAIGVLAWMNRRLLIRLVVDLERLVSSITLERDIGLTVVAVTAVLVFSVPAVSYDAPAKPFVGTETSVAGATRLSVDPAVVGDNTVTIDFTDAAGAPRRVDAAVMEIERQDIPSRRVALDLGDGTTASASPVSFGVAGRWIVMVKTVTAGVSATSTFRVDIR